MAEREICCYLPDYLDESWLESEDGPIAAVRASYFEGDTLTHRDFLGALMGCGVKRTNIAGIAAQTGITTFHTTGRKGSVDSGMRYRKEGVSMGLPSLSEYELWLTDEAEFRACAEAVHALGTPGAQA